MILPGRWLALSLLLCTNAFAQPGDPKAGRIVYGNASCIACHSFGCNRQGPLLKGVFGRSAAAVPDFPGYSEALRKSGIVWDAANLDRYLADPAKTVPGTTMTLGQVKDAKQRRDLIAFIRTEDSAVDLCPR